MQDILAISFGAVLGVNIRFKIYDKFQKINLSKDLIILMINILASFLFGLLLSVLPRISSYNFFDQLVLFLSIGCLGSLSTFSTFVYDLFDLCLKLKFIRAVQLFFISWSLGIIALAFGVFLGK